MKSIKAKHNTVLLPSGKDEVRIKTRNEAELHFESEMKQVALKHDILMDPEDNDRDTLPNSESMKGEFHVPLHVSKVADSLSPFGYLFRAVLLLLSIMHFTQCTCADGMAKFLADALSTSESKTEQRRANILGVSKHWTRGNKGIVVEKIMKEK